MVLVMNGMETTATSIEVEVRGFGAEKLAWTVSRVQNKDQGGKSHAGNGVDLVPRS